MRRLLHALSKSDGEGERALEMVEYPGQTTADVVYLDMSLCRYCLSDSVFSAHATEHYSKITGSIMTTERYARMTATSYVSRLCVTYAMFRSCMNLYLRSLTSLPRLVAVCDSCMICAFL